MIGSSKQIWSRTSFYRWQTSWSAVHSVADSLILGKWGNFKKLVMREEKKARKSWKNLCVLIKGELINFRLNLKVLQCYYSLRILLTWPSLASCGCLGKLGKRTRILQVEIVNIVCNSLWYTLHKYRGQEITQF